MVAEVKATKLTDMEYCVLSIPPDEKDKKVVGRKVNVEGPKHFFLKPGEKIEGKIQVSLNLLRNWFCVCVFI